MKNDKKNYMKIGSFKQDSDGNLEGNIFGLGLGVVPVTFQPVAAKDGKAFLRGMAGRPDEPYDVGAAFPREDKNNTAYYSVTLDSMIFPSPINGALFPDKNNPASYNMVWSRPDIDQAPKTEGTPNVNFPGLQQEGVTNPTLGHGKPIHQKGVQPEIA